METTTKDTNGKPAAMKPAELFHALSELVGRLHDWQLADEYRKAKQALEAVERKVDRGAEKKLRIMRAASVEEAEAILEENPVDDNLKKLCNRLGGWKTFQEAGATDEQITRKLLAGLPKYASGYEVPRWEQNYGGRVGDLQAWVDPDDSNKAIKGAAVVAAVRRAMSIPKPAAPTKPAAKKAAAAPAKKKGSTKAPAKAPAAAPPDAGGGDDDEGGGAGGAATVAKPTEAELREHHGRGSVDGERPRAKGGPAYRPQTWGQWAATLRGINDGVSLDPNVPGKSTLSEQERFFLEQFNAKKRPADARDAWKARQPAAKAIDAKELKRRRREFEIAAERAGDDKLRAELKKLTGLKVSNPDGMDGLRCEVIRAELDKREPAAPIELHINTRDEQGRKQPLDAGTARAVGKLAQAAYDVEAKKQRAAAAAPEPAPAPPAIELQPGQYYDADRLGLTPEALAANLAAVAILPPGNPNDGNPAPSPARIGTPLRIAGRFWAAVSASNEHRRVTYQLAPLIPEGAAGGIVLYEDFDDLRQDDDDETLHKGRPAGKAPEEYDLEGLGVVDPQNLRWVVAADEIYLRVPRDPAAEAAKTAQAAHDEALAEGKSFGEAVNAGMLALARAAAPPADDPNVDGKGVYVAGVREVWVTGTAKGDAAKVVIRVAKGADGMYRTGHLLEFPGAQVWQADSDEPVRLDGQAAESEAYAIRARANILANAVKAAPGSGKGGAWTPEQRRAYGAAVKALENFIAHNPAARPPGQQKAKAG